MYRTPERISFRDVELQAAQTQGEKTIVPFGFLYCCATLRSKNVVLFHSLQAPRHESPSKRHEYPQKRHEWIFFVRNEGGKKGCADKEGVTIYA